MLALLGSDPNNYSPSRHSSGSERLIDHRCALLQIAAVVLASSYNVVCCDIFLGATTEAGWEDNVDVHKCDRRVNILAMLL